MVSERTLGTESRTRIQKRSEYLLKKTKSCIRIDKFH